MSTQALQLEDKTLLFIEGSTTDYVELQADVIFGVTELVSGLVAGTAPDVMLPSGAE